MKHVHFVIRWILEFLTPTTWRKILTGRVRIALYLSSGQTVKFNVTNWKTSGLSGGPKSYTAEGMREMFAFGAGEIVGWQEVRWW